MKKVLLLMMLMCVIIVGVFNTNLGFSEIAWGEDSAYKVTTTSVNNTSVGEILNCGDSYITTCEKIDTFTKYQSVSAYGNDYVKLNDFINKNKLTLVERYWIDGVLVSSYYSPWFSSIDGINFQVADYGANYVIGHPFIFEGF